MFAVLKTGGKQYKVQAGDVLRVEKLNAAAGDKVQFNEILMVGSTLGAPLVHGSCVQAEVIDHHVHLLARWGDRSRHVFVANALLEELAGRSLSRTDAAAYANGEARRLIEAAHRRAREGGSDRATIALELASDLD